MAEFEGRVRQEVRRQRQVELSAHYALMDGLVADQQSLREHLERLYEDRVREEATRQNRHAQAKIAGQADRIIELHVRLSL